MGCVVVRHAATRVPAQPLNGKNSMTDEHYTDILKYSFTIAQERERVIILLSIALDLFAVLYMG